MEAHYDHNIRRVETKQKEEKQDRIDQLHTKQVNQFLVLEQIYLIPNHVLKGCSLQGRYRRSGHLAPPLRGCMSSLLMWLDHSLSPTSFFVREVVATATPITG